MYITYSKYLQLVYYNYSGMTGYIQYPEEYLNISQFKYILHLQIERGSHNSSQYV